MDFMDLEKTQANINFIPCITWVKRGVAKPDPERVKLTSEELTAVIKQTKKDLSELENESEGEEKENKVVTENTKPEVVSNVKSKSSEKKDKTDAEVMAEYGLDDYDEEEEGAEGAARLLGLGDLTAYSDPKEDPYLSALDKDIGDEDEEDMEDFKIRGTDNLILAGHVEGDSSTLEVYVYNDVEDALYIHHDILLPSFPLALEWLSFDPESDTRGNLVAVGTMQPVIEVWDLDLVDCLEPVFRLGRKARKKKGIPGVGHKDAVLSLSWNTNCDHVMASGSVDQSVLLWDLTNQTVASKITSHKEKVQSIAFHPLEGHTLVTGCCDNTVRVFDCRTVDQHKKWVVGGEVERVIWDHFNPYCCLASTDQGQVQYIDVRKDSGPVWTLSAHTQAVTGLSMSTQCPGCITTVSQDKVLKVWDISGESPQFVCERDVKLGQLQTVVACPDAPFVVCMGGDKSSDNMKVLDIRDSAQVRSRFGKRQLQNPLKTAEFGFATADEAEPGEDMETEAVISLGSMTLGSGVTVEVKKAPVSGGAISKFKKKNKEKKTKKKF
eukprot:GFUD01042438.1.p1 GENE.GFUD01042438.1~~GFUD01042438.1.p1  ORF type:complete len:552 (+),score=182.11 GFUD01042438.1:59-1714(+)